LLKVRDAHIAQLEGLGQDPLGREDDLKAALDSLESSLKDAQEQLVCVLSPFPLTLVCCTKNSQG